MRDFIDVRDVVKINILLAGAIFVDPAKSGVYNIGSGESKSLKDVLSMLGVSREQVQYEPARQGEARVTLADNQKLLKVLRGFKFRRLKDYLDGKPR